METDALPLERGGVEMTQLLQPAASPPIHAVSHENLTPSHETENLLRRVRSVQDAAKHGLLLGYQNRSRSRPGPYGAMSVPRTGQYTSEITFTLQDSFRSRGPLLTSELDVRRFKTILVDIVVNGTSGVIAFLLSSTLAVSCASVLVGHGTPLSTVIAHFIDINLLGTAVLSVILAWQSCAPWTLGAIDVFVAPVMADMAERISDHLHGDLDKVVPTTVVMVAMTSIVLGLVFFIMGLFRVTSIANYMPYPVIAGFLSGIGAQLMKNGIHMASSKAVTAAFFTLKVQLLLLPAIAFAGFARLGQYLKLPVAFSFPCLLALSLVGFQVMSFLSGASMETLTKQGWVFSWDPLVVAQTPMWFPWSEIDFHHVHWHTLSHECTGFMVSLVILGALKYSVATTSLSTLFGRDISPDNEMRVIGLANLASGLLGCCGGCHYLSAMGIMKQFEAHEKVPALVCASLVILLWMMGIRLLQYVPKFIFGGLLLSVGLHFLEAYLVTPFHFLKPIEKFTVVLITLSFLIVGMLESVAMGIIISMIELIWRIHAVGCVHHETTGALTRSAVDRTPEQTAFLDLEGSAIFVLRLQGYLFFGTSVNIIERIETRVHSLEFPKLKFVIIDFGLVPSFDATALLNFRKTSRLADLYMFDIYFCGLKPEIELALRQNQTSRRIHFLGSDVDIALEICEDALLPENITPKSPQRGRSLIEFKQMSQLELWEQFMIASPEQDGTASYQKLLPLAAYLEIIVVPSGSQLVPEHLRDDTYFICFGFMNFVMDSEFSTGHSIPGVRHSDVGDSDNPDLYLSDRIEEFDANDLSGLLNPHRLSLAVPEESQWTPFTTAKSRLLKIGPGSVITPNVAGMDPEYKYLATSDCVMLRLRASAMETLESQAPHSAVAVLKLINVRLATRFRHSSKRVSQMSSLLYK
ncbi:cyclic nucleotide-binding protein [Plasmopara halstedii]|uniref:Cyclic nucleotide-binding protein n=1 Tax=Plasmopara halstedii TaxID=4781 RepID=A0A0P1A7J2_PLAHL|nr:cyclic nucleotide-binding protein [Plasmopara halstedii]CEG36581.1 cyclic nucleotide-binding protein [Plasmopara halstedii]|eukprot:XP_024572950.1 cyclic nucleotide-binding protein [Plasmopara halstedii]